MTRVTLAEKFSWTIEYIDGLDDMTLAEIAGVFDAQNRVEKKRAKKRAADQKRKVGRGRRRRR